MQITKHTDYAFRVLIYLASLPHSEKATIYQITSTYGISKSHVMKIVNKLATHNVIDSTRGKTGGIRLALPAIEINLASIVELMEPSLTLIDCHQSRCLFSSHCRLKGFLTDAIDAFINQLRQHSLADLINDQTVERLALPLTVKNTK